MKFSILAPLLIGSAPVTVHGMISSPHPFNETQPDGTTVTLRIHGNPYDRYVTDNEGYTVLKSDFGEFVYAKRSKSGMLLPSTARVGQEKPERGLPKNLRPTHIDCKGRFCDDQGGRRGRNLRGNMEEERRRRLASIPSTMKNLVVPILWAGHDDRTLPNKNDIDILMNHQGPHALCPTGSVRDVFLENSYGTLTLESTVVDWVPMDNTEQYYAAGNSGLTSLTHDAIRYALTYLDQNNLVDYSAFDEDNDGYIDAITFLHSGYAAEWGGTDQYQTYYTDRIWSHKWALNGNPFTSSSGVKVFEYHISPGVWGTSGSDIGRMGVIAHETGHFLGLPDLYDGSGGSGIGNFGLMANSWGFDGSQYYPPYLSAWSRLQLGWASATAPVEGANVIEAASIQDATQPQLYKIDEGFPSGEYLLIENRQAAGFDGALPQGGLAIFHIDENAPSFTTEGYPGQAGWPQNGNHYRVALLQADGNYNMEKGHNRGDGGDVYHGNGVASITPSVDVATGPFPNTDAYQSGIVQPTHVFITDISVSSNVMTFSYHTGSAIATGSPSSNPTDHPSNAPSTAPTMPTSTPSSTPTQAPSASPTMAPIMPCALANVGESCSGNEDCCSGSCSGGKPSKRVCLGLSPTEAPAGGTSPTEAPDAGGDCLATGTLCRGGGCNSCCSGATTGSGKTKTCT